METTDILIGIVGLASSLAISVIGFFLKNALNEIKEVKTMALETKQTVAVLKTDYVNKIESLTDKLSLLNDGIEKLTNKIDKLNNKI